MLNFEDMDVGIDFESLCKYIDWNEEVEVNFQDNLPTPIESPHPGLHEPNLTNEPLQQELEACAFEIPHQIQNNEELAAAPMPIVQNSLGLEIATENLAKTIEPISDQASNTVTKSTSDQTYDIESVERFLEGGASSFQDKDITQPRSFNQFPDMENENLQTIQGVCMPEEHSLSNNTMLVPNIIENSNFSEINHQLAPNPTLLHPNHVEARAGMERGHSSAQFITNQSSVLVPPQNNSNIPNAHTPWDFIRPPQSFVTLPNIQVSQPSEMQKIFDLKSQKSLLPVYPTYPRVEPSSHLQPGSVTMAPNPYAYQHGHRSMQPEPALPSEYPPLYGNHDIHHHTHAIGTNGHGQQGVASVQPSKSLLGVLDQINNDYNGRMNNLNNAANFQGKNHILQKSAASSSCLASSQPLRSGIQGFSSTMTNEGTTNSQVFSSGDDEVAQLLRKARAIAQELELQQANRNSTNRVTTQLDKGKLPESSSTGSQPSAAIRRILNMRSSSSSTMRKQQKRKKVQWIVELEKNLEKYTREGPFAPGRRGRPPKRRNTGETSSSLEKRECRSSVTGNAGITPALQEAAYKAPENVQNNGNHNTNPTPSIDPRRIPNGVFDPKYDRAILRAASATHHAPVKRQVPGVLKIN